jgi:hypothetical protein
VSKKQRLCWDAEIAASKGMRQYNATETSTRMCVCGASVTWSGFDDRVGDFMVHHASCVGVPAILACGKTYVSRDGYDCACSRAAGHKAECGGST